MIFVILIVAIVFCAVILYLPYAAGLTTVEKQSHKKKRRESISQAPEQFSGYLPPDEELRLQEEQKEKAKTSAFKDKVNITSERMPIQIKLNQGGVLRKRTERHVGDFNPNNYDYDLDELIREETEGEAQKEAKKYYAGQTLGGDKEAMV